MFPPKKKTWKNERLLVLHKLKCVVSCGQPCSSCLHTSLKSNLTWMRCEHSFNELPFQSHQLGLTYPKKHDGLHHFFMGFKNAHLPRGTQILIAVRAEGGSGSTRCQLVVQMLVATNHHSASEGEMLKVKVMNHG